MSQALKKLLDLLFLEKIEEGIFRGQSEDLGLRQVFGGKLSVRRFMRQNKLSPLIEWSIHSTAIFYVRGTAANPSFMT